MHPIGKEQLFKSLEGGQRGNGRKKPKVSSVPVKRDQPHEQESIGKNWRDEKGGTGERSGANHFSGGFTALGLYIYVFVYMCARVREFEQLNHWNFISVRRSGNITVHSVVIARDFGFGAALLPQNFFHSSAANHPQESEEASFIGREESPM